MDEKRLMAIFGRQNQTTKSSLWRTTCSKGKKESFSERLMKNP
jgi:hypothetical protein